MTEMKESSHTTFLRYEKVSGEWVAVLDIHSSIGHVNKYGSSDLFRLQHHALIDRRDNLRDAGYPYEVSEKTLENWPKE